MEPFEVIKSRIRLLIRKWTTLAGSTTNHNEKRIWLLCAEDLKRLLEK
jgi:hypothetical protein